MDVRTAFVCRDEQRAPEDAAGLDRTIPVADGVGYAVHGTLDYFLEFTPTYALLWLLAGMLAAAAPTARSRASTRSGVGGARG